MSAPLFTVLVPAHNEGRIIGKTLAGIIAGGSPPPPVIVICNACTDDTATQARTAHPGALVVETDTPGKSNAINLGLDHAAPGIVIVVDADIIILRAALDALAVALAAAGVATASPAVQFDVTEADPIVKAYYRVFASHSYVTSGVGGAGVYGMSLDGRQRLGRLPQLRSDDDFVRHFFAPEEQQRVSVDAAGNPVRAIVRPPRSVIELVLTESRWRSGDAYVRRQGGPASTAPAGGAFRRFRNVAAARAGAEAGVAAFAAYLGVKLLGRGMLAMNRLRKREHIWHRDESSRDVRQVR